MAILGHWLLFEGRWYLNVPRYWLWMGRVVFEMKMRKDAELFWPGVDAWDLKMFSLTDLFAFIETTVGTSPVGAGGLVTIGAFD